MAAAMPIVHKLWADELPQKKALENNRRAAREHEHVTELFETLFAALELGCPRVWFGDSMPMPVVVVCENNSPLVWLNTEALGKLDEPELRFLAGYCAALIWSELGALQHLDGRRMWHLLEGVALRQTGRGLWRARGYCQPRAGRGCVFAAVRRGQASADAGDGAGDGGDRPVSL